MKELPALTAPQRIALAQGQEAQARKSLEGAQLYSRILSAEIRELRKRLGESEESDPSIWHVDRDEAMRKAATRALEEPTDRLCWNDLDTVLEVDGEEKYHGLWARVGDEARLSIESGDDAVKMIRPCASPSEHARLLVIRQGLIDEWSPRPGTEMMIVDLLVQTRFLYETWLQRHVFEATNECQYLAPAEKDRVRYGEWYPPRVSEVESIQLSAMMVTRFQNQFMKLVRALRDLRRMSPALVIQNAGQVNVGQQQVNVGRRNSMRNAPQPITFRTAR